MARNKQSKYYVSFTNLHGTWYYNFKLCQYIKKLTKNSYTTDYNHAVLIASMHLFNKCTVNLKV